MTFHHLVTMLYAVYNKCHSLREVATGLLALDNRIGHILDHFPRRATLSDANNRRKQEVFEDIYLHLLEKNHQFLSDSRKKTSKRKLYIFDSTVITLFNEVMRGTGLVDKNGKRKGGAKVHTLMDSDRDVPCMIRFSEAKNNDVQFLKYAQVPAGSVIVFDRGYPDFKTYNLFTQQKIMWVTRKKSNAVYEVTFHRYIDPAHADSGVVSDEEILLGNNHHKNSVKVSARLICYTDRKTGKSFEFLTNNFKMSPLTIANYYKKRWQIELLFKRLKQNYPLRYFLGESENAIKIQIWCVLIADLLLKVIHKTSQCKWAYSTLAAVTRMHLMTYIKIKQLLGASEKQILDYFNNRKQKAYAATLFPT